MSILACRLGVEPRIGFRLVFLNPKVLVTQSLGDILESKFMVPWSRVLFVLPDQNLVLEAIVNPQWRAYEIRIHDRRR